MNTDKPTTEEFLFLLPSYPCSSVFICGQFRFFPEVGPLRSSSKTSGCWHPHSISSSNHRPASVSLEPLVDGPAALATGASPPQTGEVGLALSHQRVERRGDPADGKIRPNDSSVAKQRGRPADMVLAGLGFVNRHGVVDCGIVA